MLRLTKTIGITLDGEPEMQDGDLRTGYTMKLSCSGASTKMPKLSPIDPGRSSGRFGSPKASVYME
jgi:hypothetical protein